MPSDILPATALQRRDERAARVPIQAFATTMGLGGLANAWLLAAETWGLAALPGQILAGLTCALLVACIGLYSSKFLYARSAVLADISHPTKSTFLAAITASTVLASMLLRRWNPVLASWVWGTAAAAHLLLTIYFLRRWILVQQDEAEMTPAWLIPIAGNLLVAVAGASFGAKDVAWAMFSVGMVFWIVLFTIAMHRVVFCAPLTDRSFPTLFVLLAPPSIGLSALLALTEGQGGAATHVLYWFAAFMALLVASVGFRLARLQFFLSWWAITFPSAGWAAACIAYYRVFPRPATLSIACIALAFSTFLVALVFVRTLLALLSGELLRDS